MPNAPHPVLLALDATSGVEGLRAELDDRYGRSYEVVVTDGPKEALQRLSPPTAPVALVLAARVEGAIELLRAAKQQQPHAQRALLLGAQEFRADREAIAATLAAGDAGHWVDRPAGQPDERFHRGVTELLDGWWRLRGRPSATVHVIAPARTAEIHTICDKLQRNDCPYVLLDSDCEEGRTRLAAAGIPDCDELVVVLHDGTVLVDPEHLAIAEALGARLRPQRDVYDVVVVGGGPAGLAAAVYAGSEGLTTALVERDAMGGQAGTSSLIRNYLGFPRGVSGAELASRAFDQAVVFGTDMVYGQSAVGLRDDGESKAVILADGTEVRGRAVILAGGVSYRRLPVDGLERLLGVGVYYGAAMSAAASIAGQRAVVVGGGNSAGQAAVHLSRFASEVLVVVRGGSLAASMSDYLVRELTCLPNVHVRYGAEVVDGAGEGALERVTLRDRDGREEEVEAAGLFVLIGAEPHTGWLPPSVVRDDWGYVLTGEAAGRPGGLFETTVPRVFAVGDARAGSVKRVASAVGEGSVCVRFVHDALAQTA